MVRCPPAARSLAIAGGVKCFELESRLLQQTVCPRNSEFMRHLLVNRCTTTEAPPFVRLAKTSRLFNSLITEQAVADSAHCFASSLGGAQPTLAMPCRPAARPLTRARGWQVFRTTVPICKKSTLRGEFGTCKPKWLRKRSRRIVRRMENDLIAGCLAVATTKHSCQIGSLLLNRCVCVLDPKLKFLSIYQSISLPTSNSEATKHSMEAIMAKCPLNCWSTLCDTNPIFIAKFGTKQRRIVSRVPVNSVLASTRVFPSQISRVIVGREYLHGYNSKMRGLAVHVYTARCVLS